MGINFNERDLASVIIEDSLKEKVACTQMLQKQQKRNQVTPNKLIGLLCICFSIIYLSSMILATVFVQQDYEETFDANVDTIKEIVCSSAGQDINGCVNLISNLGIAQDERQMFSAAVYDAEGKMIAMTKPSLFFMTDEGKTYYFPLEECFDDSQIKELFDYARGTTEPYVVVAEIGIKQGKLLSLKLVSKATGKENTVWQWENEKITSNIQEEIYQFSKYMPVRQMLSVPYYGEAKAYEKWVSNEFLQGFTQEIHKDARKTTTSYETFTLSKSKVECITKVTYMNDLGEKVNCFIAIRSVGNTLVTSMKLFVPVYVVGLVLTLGGMYLAVGYVKKIKEV